MGYDTIRIVPISIQINESIVLCVWQHKLNTVHHCMDYSIPPFFALLFPYHVRLGCCYSTFDKIFHYCFWASFLTYFVKYNSFKRHWSGAHLGKCCSRTLRLCHQLLGRTYWSWSKLFKCCPTSSSWFVQLQHATCIQAAHNLVLQSLPDMVSGPKLSLSMTQNIEAFLT